MDKTYWLGRKRSAMAMARGASTAESRLIHYELAGRYSIKAAQCLPFMLPRSGPATGGERAELHVPAPASCPPRPPRNPLSRDDPAGDDR